MPVPPGRSLVALTVCSVVLAGAPPSSPLSAAFAAGRAPAAEPAGSDEERYRDLFGDSEKAVRATGSKADDVALAREVLAGAGRLSKDPALQAFMYNKACDLGLSTPEGLEVAAAAMEALAGAQPRHAGRANERLLLVRQRQLAVARGAKAKSAAADAYLDALDTLVDAAADRSRDFGRAAALCTAAVKVLSGQHRKRVVARLNGLKSAQAAEKKATDLAARLDAGAAAAATAAELVRLLLIELDRPADARPHAAAAADPALERIVALANRDPEDLGADDAVELGDWYRAQSDKAAAGGWGKARARAKAVACYERFLAAYRTEDARRLAVERALAAVSAGGPKQSAAAANRRPKVVNLLPLIDAKKDTLRGAWGTINGDLSIDGEAQLLRIPYRPPDEYDFGIEFTRTGGPHGVGLTASHAGRRFTWLFGAWENAVSGLQLVDGKDSASNPTTVRRPGFVSDGKRHTAVVKVRAGKVSAYLDGELLSEHATDYSDLSAYPTWDVGDDTLGVGGQCRAVIHRIELVEVAGTGRALKRAEGNDDRRGKNGAE